MFVRIPEDELIDDSTGTIDTTLFAKVNGDETKNFKVAPAIELNQAPNLEQLNTGLNNEASNRTALIEETTSTLENTIGVGDTILQNSINDEVNARIAAIDNVNNELDNEIITRENEVASINTSLTTINAGTETLGSISNKIQLAINALKDGVDIDLDTLKELSDALNDTKNEAAINLAASIAELRNELRNGAGTTMDTFKEVEDKINTLILDINSMGISLVSFVDNVKYTLTNEIDDVTDYTQGYELFDFNIIPTYEDSILALDFDIYYGVRRTKSLRSKPEGIIMYFILWAEDKSTIIDIAYGIVNGSDKFMKKIKFNVNINNTDLLTKKYILTVGSDYKGLYINRSKEYIENDYKSAVTVKEFRKAQ